MMSCAMMKWTATNLSHQVKVILRSVVEAPPPVLDAAAAVDVAVRLSMSRLGEMRALRRDPAGREPLPGIGMGAAGLFEIF